MNILGPYASQQLLLHAVRHLVQNEATQCANIRTGLRSNSASDVEPGDTIFDEDLLNREGPTVTWPLGEIIAARHDQQHSRVFNS